MGYCDRSHHGLLCLLAGLFLLASSICASAQSAFLLPNASQQFFNASGQPLAGGSVYLYTPNTTNCKTVWSDPFETTPYSCPLTLDAGGFPQNGGSPNAGIYGTGNYTEEVYDANNNLIFSGYTTANAGSVVGPSTSVTGDFACWSNTVGTTLSDCGGQTQSYSTSLTISAGNCNGTVVETGAFQTITLPSSLIGFPSSCPVRVVNGSSSRAQALSGFPSGASPISGCGSSNQCLYPGQDSIVVGIVNSAWAVLQPAALIQGALKLYADPSGSDNNDGLSSGAPLQHIQTAINLIEQYMIGAGGTNTISLNCSETYDENLTIAGDAEIGAHLIEVVGNTGTPGDCVINGASSSYTLFLTDYSTAIFNGVTLEGGTSVVKLNQHSTLDLENFQIGSCAASNNPQLFASYGGILNLDTNFNWIGNTNCGSFIQASGAGAQVNVNGVTITISSGMTLGSNYTFVATQSGVINGGWVFSGSLTAGKEYQYDLCGNINSASSSYPSGTSGTSTGSCGEEE